MSDGAWADDAEDFDGADDLDRIDGLEGVDDEPATDPLRPTLLPSFASSKAERFARVLGEVAPMIRRSAALSEASAQKRTLARLIGMHKDIVSDLYAHWGIDSSEEPQRWLSLIASNTASLIESGSICENSWADDLQIVLEAIDEYLQEDEPLSGMEGAANISDDILVNIKVITMASSLKFYNIATHLCKDQSTLIYWLKWHQTLSIAMAKDLAVNWDKQSHFKDRQSLFETALPHCAEIAMSVWCQHLSKSLECDAGGLDDVSLWSLLGEFEQAVEDCDMGYFAHDHYNIDWLKQQVCEHIRQRANTITCSIHIKSLAEAMSYFYAESYCAALAPAWARACAKTIEQVTSMLDELSEPQRAAWELSEGSKPMPMARVYAEIDGGEDASFFYRALTLDESSMMKDAKSRLALIWGLSDALCKLMKPNSHAN